MRVLFYTDLVMHYVIPTLRELERRIQAGGGEFILVSGIEKRSDNSGRVGIKKSVTMRHSFIRFHEWKCDSYTFRWQPALAGTVRKTKPEIVIVLSHPGSPTYWHLGPLCKKEYIKYVTWNCGYEYNPGRLKSLLVGKFLERFDHHLAYHTNAEKYLLSHGVDKSRITVIHNTIDEREIKLLPKDKARQWVETEFGLPPGKPIILYVGALLAEKRLNILIDAFRQVEFGLASLIIVGDGPAREDLKRMSTDLKNIRFPGRVVDGVGRFFDAADVFVLPGTGGLAINEAMAHGLPIITGYADGSAEDLVEDGVNGFYLNEADADQIAVRLNSLLQNPDIRLKMGRASRERITSKYSFESFIDRIIRALNEALCHNQMIDKS